MSNSRTNIQKAVLYARVSTEEQAERDYSIPAQLKAIHEYAKKNGIQIIKEYVDEGKSAKTADRPQFQQMINAAKSKDKEFTTILIHKTDRFARNRSDSVVYKSLLRSQCGVEVVSITENFDDSPTGKLLEGMMEVIAEFHSLNLAQEVMKGMRQKAEQGLYIGRAPYGYILGENGKLLVNEDEARIVNMIYEMYIAGNSFGQIRYILNNRGILTSENCMWDTSAVRRVIINTVYTGCYTWNKFQDAQRKQKDPSEWIIVEGTHEAIVSKEIFEKARKVLSMKSTMRGKTMKSIYLLSSLIKCGHCGHNLIGEKDAKPNKTYYRYVCGHHLNHKMCFRNFVHKDEIERAVLEEIKKISMTGKVETESVVVVQSDNGESEVEILETQLKRAKQKYQRQLEAYEAGILTLQELQEAKNRVKQEEQEILEQLEQLKRKKEGKDVGVHLKEYFSDIDELLEENDMKALKLWLKERIYKIEVFNSSEVNIQYKLSL